MPISEPNQRKITLADIDRAMAKIPPSAKLNIDSPTYLIVASKRNLKELMKRLRQKTTRDKFRDRRAARKIRQQYTIKAKSNDVLTAASYEFEINLPANAKGVFLSPVNIDK